MDTTKTAEELIWDTITDSAKKRFDYDAFENKFGDHADYILFMTIVGYSIDESKEVITGNILSQVLMSGYKTNRDEIYDFIRDKEEKLKFEIFAANLAGRMLENGDDPIDVLQSINKIL